MSSKPPYTAAEMHTLIEFFKTYGGSAAPAGAPAPAEQEPEPLPEHYSFTYTDAPGATMPAADARRYEPAPRPASIYPAMAAMRQTIAALWRDTNGAPPDFAQKLSDLENQRDDLERLIDRQRHDVDTMRDLQWQITQENAELKEALSAAQQGSDGYRMIINTASQAAAVSAALLAEKDATITRLIAAGFGQAAPAPAEPAASALTPEAWIANRKIGAILERYAVTAEPDPDNAGAVAIFHDDGFLMLLSPAITLIDLDRILAMWKETGFNHYKEGKTDGAKEIRRDLRRALGLED